MEGDNYFIYYEYRVHIAVVDEDTDTGVLIVRYTTVMKRCASARLLSVLCDDVTSVALPWLR